MIDVLILVGAFIVAPALIAAAALRIVAMYHTR